MNRLKRHLTKDNHQEVLAEARHKTITEIEKIVARLSPQPDKPSRVRRVAQPAAPRADVASPGGPTEHSARALGTPLTSTATSAASPAPASSDAVPERPSTPAPAPRRAPESPPAPAPRRAPDPKPLAPRRYHLSATIGEQGNDTLRQLQDLLAHQIPDGDPAAIVELALEALLEKTLKKKAALTSRPRAAAASGRASTTRSRHIPAPVRRAVWARDGGQCGFVGDGGRQCTETRRLEYAHLEPWARGGEHSVDNVGLRCRPHNVYEAHRDYGRAFMDAKRRKPADVRERHAPYVKAHRLVSKRVPESITTKALLRAPPHSLPNASGRPQAPRSPSGPGSPGGLPTRAAGKPDEFDLAAATSVRRDRRRLVAARRSSAATGGPERPASRSLSWRKM